MLGRSSIALSAVLIAAGAAPLIVAYVRLSRSAHSVSATTTIAGVITLALGALATGQHPAIAFACGAVVTLLLASKRQLHRMIGTLGEGDVQAIAHFAIVAGAVLPFLSNRNYGPLQAWNPFQLWFVVVLVTGFSFAGYVANKLVGARRGTLVTAAIGGMYSSTVVTVALARRLREGAGADREISAGIALATAIMFVRVLVLTGVLAGFALLPLAKVIGVAAAVAILFCAWLIHSADASGESAEVASTNPFALLPAIGFALLVGAMALGARWTKVEFGDAVVSILLAITGGVRRRCCNRNAAWSWR